jgi:glutamate synthase domain-containing protein 1
MDRKRRVLDQKDIGGCAIAGIMCQTRERFSGEAALRAIANMRERANGLGGGFAAYGIYPDHADHYAMHTAYDAPRAKEATEALLSARCEVHGEEPIPTRPIEAVSNEPILHRYFVNVKREELRRRPHLSEDDLIVDLVMEINAGIEDAFVYSSGKNMGVFKGVGYPEDIGEFFRLEEYEAHTWIAHGRFPTNTSGWWGGAHPFGLLDWAIVHNGEISSYGVNRRYVANFGYYCTLQTDTEVIAYLFDLLIRKHGLPLEAAFTAMAPPFWSEIERMPEEEAREARTLRGVYGGALLNGPFSVIVGHSGGMIGFSDRVKLRPMVAARNGQWLYIASEEAAIREVCADPKSLWRPEGGEAVVGELEA